MAPPAGKALAPSPSPSSTIPDPLVRVRLTNVTYSLAKPEPGVDQLQSGFSLGHSFAEVPVIRVLGITEGGQVRRSPYVLIAHSRSLDLP
jgi:hypothetical protein